MGLGCSKAKHREAPEAAPAARLSPFGRFRSLSRGLDEQRGCQPKSLLQLSVEAAADNLASLPRPQLLALAAADNLARLPRPQLLALPTDLAQLILERLIDTERLDAAALPALAGQQFYSFDLTAYSKPVRGVWLRVLCTPSLESAVLSRTPVTDACLLALTGLPRLRRLRLEHCVDLTDAAMAALQGLTALTELSLAGCQQLTEFGTRWLEGLDGLQSLSLELCNRVAGLGCLLGMRQLRLLNLGWCGAVTDADMLVVARLQRLQDLQISYTQVSDTGLVPLRGLTGITSLGLGGLSGVTDRGAAGLLRVLPALRVLCLERCGRVGDEALTALAGTAVGVEDLSLAYTACTDAGIRHLEGLPSMRVLSLDKCDRVGDRGAHVVSSLTALERLDLTDTNITNATLRCVGRLPRLERLNLSFTGANDWGLQHLSRLTSLKRLSLDSDPAWQRFTDAGMEHLAALTNLECLDLFAARITDVGCRHISKLSRLHSLEICSGHVSDKGAGALASGLKRLRHLSLAHNRRVTSACLPLLAGLTHLTALNLSESGIAGGLVVLSSLTALDTLALHGTKVRPAAADKLQALLPRLRVQGAGTVPPGG
ncbi:hypothetical protein N2152v2_005183 [Parachlorella kessleri]